MRCGILQTPPPKNIQNYSLPFCSATSQLGPVNPGSISTEPDGLSPVNPGSISTEPDGLSPVNPGSISPEPDGLGRHTYTWVRVLFGQFNRMGIV
jgi:hypothetical protein